MKTRNSKLGVIFFLALVAFLGAASAATPFRLVSQRETSQAAPAGGRGDSVTPILTPDGRYVLFASTANNLVLNASSNALPVLPGPPLNVFVRDRTNGTTTLVSVNHAGTGGGSGDSIPAAISSDGRYALFESSARDLAASATNGFTEIFLRDLASNTTYLVSVSTNGGPANGVCRGSVMTPDGRYVAFVSEANNLVPRDTNGIPDIFLRDLQNQTTTLVSVGARGTNSPPVAGSESPEISADGRYVAFYSAAINLAPGVTNGGEIYLRDVVGATTLWASAGAHPLLGQQYVFSFSHALSTDGQYVAYQACANPSSGFDYVRSYVLRFNVGTGLTDLIHTNAYAPQMGADEVATLDMTPDGRFVTFIAKTNGTGITTCILLWDAQTGTTTLVSGDLNGNVQSNSICNWPTIDPTGRFVAFLSTATNLVANPVMGDSHLYVRDTQAGTTALVNVDTNGAGPPLSTTTAPRLSGDGTLVVFDSLDAGLVADDRNHDADVFLRDLNAGTIGLISAHDPALPSSSPNGASAIASLCASADGRWVAFSSDADNLVVNDTNALRDVFVRDVRYGTNLLVSLGISGVSANGDSTEAAISADGRYVAFTSWADNLVSGDTNRNSDVFLRDLVLGTTTLVSINTSGTGPGNNASYSPVLSSDGRFVLFRSGANNLASGSFSVVENLFLRDVQAGTNYALTTSGLSSASMTRDGRLVAFTDVSGASSGKIYLWDSLAGARIETNSTLAGVSNISISPDGSKIACFAGTGTLVLIDRVAGTNGPISSGYGGSRAGLRFSADSLFLTYAAAPTATGTNQVYLYDSQAASNVLVSSAFGLNAGGSASSDSPDISADGRFVAYRSFATNLLAVNTSNTVPNLFLYDRLAGTTTLLSTSRFTGAPGDNRSLAPVFTADGRNLLFQSWASDLIPLDFNHWDDVFTLAFPYVSIAPGSIPGQGPTLTWPVRPGETYQVQFKNSLGDINWQDVTGTVIFEGNQAHLTDLAPSTGQRYYRVTAF